MSTTQHRGGDAIARIGARLLRSRRLMRAPIWLYRARLGALLGSRVLMLEHIGRTSGARRYVVLERLGHQSPDTYVVASGFGTRAQWFRNVVAEPRVRVTIGSRAPARAVARVLDRDEADRALADYRDRHPRAWERFTGILAGTLGAPVADVGSALPLVELRIVS